MPANTPLGYPYPLPTEPVAEGAAAIRSLAESLKGWQLLEEKDPSGSINVFSAIPQTFDHLRMLVKCRSVGASKWEDLCMRLNGITAAQYFTSNIQVSGGAVSANQTVNQTYSVVGLMPGTTGAAAFYGVADILIPHYSLGTQYKHWTGTAFAHSPVASTTADLYSILVGGTASGNQNAVTSITLFASAAGNLLATGSRAWLYGIASA